jgi:hypothetical protein
MVLPGESVPTLPFLAGLTLTADVDHVAEFLRLQRVACLVHNGRIIVSARDACGSAVVFASGAIN